MKTETFVTRRNFRLHAGGVTDV